LCKKELIEKMSTTKWSKMKRLESERLAKKYADLGVKVIGLRYFILTAVGVLTFSNFVFVLFAQTIPNIIWAFFKDVGEIIIIAAVFAFAFAWLLKSRPQKKPKKYSIVTFDVYGMESAIQGIRTDFMVHDVAWSYMKQYKKCYPLYNFALVTDEPKSDKKTIFRYI
jgi:hypothetical protein